MLEYYKVKMQILNIGDDPLQTGADGKAAVIGDLAEKDVEIGDLILHALIEIAVAHGELIKVAEHGHIQFVVVICH